MCVLSAPSQRGRRWAPKCILDRVAITGQHALEKVEKRKSGMEERAMNTAGPTPAQSCRFRNRLFERNTDTQKSSTSRGAGRGELLGVFPLLAASAEARVEEGGEEEVVEACGGVRPGRPGRPPTGGKGGAVAAHSSSGGREPEPCRCCNRRPALMRFRLQKEENSF